MNQERTENLALDALEFMHEFRSCQLATADRSSQPEASYAPFIFNQGDYYFYLSQLAKHCRNLQKNPQVSLLFIEPEHKASDIFARKRLTLQCEVQTLERDTEQWQNLMNQMQQRHGETVQMIRSLEDFQLFSCRPVKIHYVKGFAQAYSISSKEWFKSNSNLQSKM